MFCNFHLYGVLGWGGIAITIQLLFQRTFLDILQHKKRTGKRQNCDPIDLFYLILLLVSMLLKVIEAVLRIGLYRN